MTSQSPMRTMGCTAEDAGTADWVGAVIDEQDPAIDSAQSDNTKHTGQADAAVSTARRLSPQALALLFSVSLFVVLAPLAGWLWFQFLHTEETVVQRTQFLQVGRQGAVNLITIDWQHADADVHRILDSASGPFYDDFATRSQPFVDVVKHTQSKTEGTVVAVGLETVDDNTAHVLVVMSVTTSKVNAAQQPPRAWRMRVGVQRVGADIKVSSVEFVP